MRWYPWLRPDFEKLVASYRPEEVTMRYSFRRYRAWAMSFNLRPEPLFTLPTTAGPQKCGHCRGCQLMQAGTHPDYYTWLPKKGKIRWALMRYVRSPKAE